MNSPDEGCTKASLRDRMRRELKALSPETRAGASVMICQHLAVHPVWETAQAVLLYAARIDEVDLGPLLTQGLAGAKEILLPQYEMESGTYRACRIFDPRCDLVRGQFNILEPGPSCAVGSLKQLDLILVPGLAFDLYGRRLGRGRGFYDRLLAETRGLKCGVAFEEQILSQIPVEPHDIILDGIMTPSGWVDCRQRRRGDDLVG